jgi:hypothetical protein
VSAARLATVSFEPEHADAAIDASIRQEVQGEE